MKNIKLKERRKIPVEPFSYDVTPGGNTALEFAHNSAMFRAEESESFVEKNPTLINILKQVFLFFPAAFMLWNMFFGVTVIFINSNNSPGYQPYNWRFFAGFCWGIFGVWVGLGDIKKVKHLAMPFSVISISLGLALITCQSETLVQWMFQEANAFIFFPFVLIAPFLVKGIVDILDEKHSI